MARYEAGDFTQGLQAEYSKMVIAALAWRRLGVTDKFLFQGTKTCLFSKAQLSLKKRLIFDIKCNIKSNTLGRLCEHYQCNFYSESGIDLSI